MRLLVTERLSDGTTRKRVYNNETNEVFDTNGNLIDLPSQIGVERKSSVQSKYPSVVRYKGKDKDLSMLRIQLGMKCNMRCAYCSQHARAEDFVSNPRLVKTFVEKLSANGITAGEVQFWGGEPLVYWKTLKELIPAIRELMPEAKFSMITNGSLLTDEIIDFLESYGFSITISHDGPGQFLRGEDPLNDPDRVRIYKEAERRLDMRFNVVLSPANVDVKNIAAYFKKRMGENTHINFEGVMTHLGVKEGIGFNDEQIQRLSMNLFNAFLDPETRDIFPSQTAKFTYLREKLIHRLPIAPLASKCAMPSPKCMVVNLNGDVLSCTNYATRDHIVGSISAVSAVDLSGKFTPWSQREECRRCLVLQVCRGACPQIEGEYRAMTCRNEFWFALAIFQSAWHSLFGSVVTSVSEYDVEAGGDNG